MTHVRAAAARSIKSAVEDKLNENQLKAVKHDKGPMMVIAGPGSGKTTVISHRLNHMVKNLGVSGSNILVITFTRAAAAEMQQRYEQMTGSTDNITFGTFHSVFYMILKKAYRYSGSNILHETDKCRFVGEAIDKRGIAYDSRDDFVKYFVSEISYVKSNMTEPYTFVSKCGTNDEFVSVYNSYERFLRDNNKIDFDDMLVMCYQLLKGRMDIRRSLINRYRYILIDEFQDINPIQYEVVKLLMSRERNLFVVGDDDQSVYSFRGAKPELMLNLKKDFPDVLYVYLNINYRCGRAITMASERVISHNKCRFRKQITSPYQENQSERIHINYTETARDQNIHIVNQILKLNKQGVPFGQMAVLFRTNTEPRGLSHNMMEYNIPFRLKETMPDIFNHFACDNIMDYMKAAKGDLPRSRMLKIMNHPNRYISRNSLPEGQVDFDELMEVYSDKPYMVEEIMIFSRDLERISAMKPYAAINYIRKAIGYDCYINEYASARGVDAKEYMDMLDDLQEMSRDFLSFDAWFAYRTEYAKKLKEYAESKTGPEDAVTLATMHSSKGLEFDHIFIMNCVEKNIPHKKACEDDDIEEERRMFYVAMTRARYGLNIYCPKTLYGKRTLPSRFLNEMNETG